MRSDPGGWNESVALHTPRCSRAGIIDASPNIFARMLQHDDLQVRLGTSDRFAQNFEDSACCDEILGSCFPQGGDVFIQGVAAKLAAWEVDLAGLVDNQEAERRQIQIFLLKEELM